MEVIVWPLINSSYPCIYYASEQLCSHGLRGTKCMTSHRLYSIYLLVRDACRLCMAKQTKKSTLETQIIVELTNMNKAISENFYVINASIMSHL